MYKVTGKYINDKGNLAITEYEATTLSGAEDIKKLMEQDGVEEVKIYETN